MEVLVRNAEGNLPQKERDYAAKKLGKLDRYFTACQKVEITHREEKLAHRIEVTVHADGLVLHGVESDPSIHAAIDKVADKMENRLRRLKTRIVRSHRTKGKPIPNVFDELPEPVVEDDDDPIREQRHYSAKPMDLDEALLQFELTDQPFFMFFNARTRQAEAIYRLRDGGIGHLTPG
jgi:putative sigma-54 modulation protein